MPLFFRAKRYRPMKRSTQFFLAFVALAVVIAVVTAWLVLAFHENEGPEDESLSETPAVTDGVYTEADISHLLVLFNEEGQERFLLVTSDPEENRIAVTPLPDRLAVGETTLLQRYRKGGSVDAVNAVEDALGIRPEHFIGLDAEGAASWINYLEKGLPYTLPEAVKGTDASGGTLKLAKGEHNLTATQAVGLICYKGWKDESLRETVAADLLTVMINRYLTEERYLPGDFGALANLAQTSLRIGDFNQKLETLSHLAAGNRGAVASVVPLTGEEDALGNFRADPFSSRP